jgi:hypothetical protein
MKKDAGIRNSAVGTKKNEDGAAMKGDGTRKTGAGRKKDAAGGAPYNERKIRETARRRNSSAPF